jgi:hypothetical protein
MGNLLNLTRTEAGRRAFETMMALQPKYTPVNQEGGGFGYFEQGANTPPKYTEVKPPTLPIQKPNKPESIPTGRVKSEGGVRFQEVQDIDPFTRQPIRGTNPRWEPWNNVPQQSGSAAHADDPVLTRIVNAFNADPTVRKVEQMDNFANLITDAANSDNPVAHASLETLMARASGEVGNLSEADKRPFGGSRALSEKIKQYFSELYSGKKTPQNIGFVKQLAETFQKAGKRKKASLARERATQYSKANKSRGWTPQYVFETLAPFDSFEEQKDDVDVLLDEVFGKKK